jgi:PhzF family phenazine biosynthesis protein
VPARPFAQVDVFATEPYRGNPVAVVLDGEGLDDATMQQLASWTNLSETTFVLPPTRPEADYRVRIFTPSAELPFAGHPTLGTCHAWLAHTGGHRDRVVQECGAGLVEIRRTPDGLAFAAPPLVRSGPVEPALLDRAVDALGLEHDEVLDAQWVDNGPGWLAVLLESAERALAIDPGPTDLDDIGVVGFHPPGAPEAIEVRAFFRATGGALGEDPVTGSLNAAVAGWLLGSGRLRAPYVARQGTAIGRAGRVHVSQDAGGTIWVGGATSTMFEGTAAV